MKLAKQHLIAAALLACPIPLSAQLIEDEQLIASGSNWDYLYYSDVDDAPADPADANPDFHMTWHTPADYSGSPAFLNGPAMLGWGEVPNGAGNLIMTEIWGSRDGSDTPPSGQRFTCYLRTTFTPTEVVTDLRFDARIDDGAIFYINGVEVDRIRVTGDAISDPDTWMLFATGTGSEAANVVSDVTLPTPLPAGVAVDLAVSLHNANAGSSDIGFDARVVSLVPPPPVPSPNDDFADAENLANALPIDATGRSHDTVGGSGSSKELGEPAHAGDAGGASVWWNWTAAQTERISIATLGSDFDTLLGIYTGASVDALTEVVSNNDATFYARSRVEFEAQMGTTYRIAVDGLAGAFGDITLSIAAAPEPFALTELLIPVRSDWDYLLFNNSVGTFDPDALDPDGDYHTTWQTTGDYDGPAFSTGPAPLGYGEINADPIATAIFEPVSGERHAVLYLRSAFTPANAVTNLAFRGLIDDGAIIYIDGVEVARLNVSPATDAASFRATALSSNANGVGTEDGPQFVIIAQELPAGVPVEIAVSAHNSSATSSDLTFDMEVYSTTTPPPPVSGFDAFIATTASPGEYEIIWNSQFGAVYDLQFSEDLEIWTVVAPDIAGSATGTNSVVDIPVEIDGFYRVMRQ